MNLAQKMLVLLDKYINLPLDHSTIHAINEDLYSALYGYSQEYDLNEIPVLFVKKSWINQNDLILSPGNDSGHILHMWMNAEKEKTEAAHS